MPGLGSADLLKLIVSFVKADYALNENAQNSNRNANVDEDGDVVMDVCPYADTPINYFIDNLWSKGCMRNWILEKCPHLLGTKPIKYTYFTTTLKYNFLRDADSRNLPEDEIKGTSVTKHLYANNSYVDTSFNEESDEFNVNFIVKFIIDKGYFPSTFCANKKFITNLCNYRKGLLNDEDLVYLAKNSHPETVHFIKEHMKRGNLKRMFEVSSTLTDINTYFWVNIFTNEEHADITNNIHKEHKKLYFTIAVKIMRQSLQVSLPDADKLRIFKTFFSKSLYSILKQSDFNDCGAFTYAWFLKYKEDISKIVSSTMSYAELQKNPIYKDFINPKYCLSNKDGEMFIFGGKSYIPPTFDIYQSLCTMSSILIYIYRQCKDSNVTTTPALSKCKHFYKRFDISYKLKRAQSLTKKRSDLLEVLRLLNKNENDEIIEFLIDHPQMIIHSEFILNKNPIVFWYFRDNYERITSAKYFAQYTPYPFLIYRSDFALTSEEISEIYSGDRPYLYSSVLDMFPYIFAERFMVPVKVENIPKIYFTIFKKSKIFNKSLASIFNLE